MQQPSYVETPAGHRLGYVCHTGKEPGVLFLTGFKSDMEGSKALALEAHCRETGRAFLRFDYSGHGSSSGKFEEGTIGAWLADAVAVLDQLTEGPQVIVGSSMGGWIALLLALARPQRVAGLVGIAAAPDFTEELIWRTLPGNQRREMVERGFISIPNCYGEDPYIITHRLVEEGRDHLLLGAPIPIHCPVRLLHGEKDEDVPWQHGLKLVEKLESTDVAFTLVKGAGHRLSEPEHLNLLCNTVESILHGNKNPGNHAVSQGDKYEACKKA